jgi:hypothetical protein
MSLGLELNTRLHELGLTQTYAERVAQARADLSSAKNLSINGLTPQDFAKVATDKQVLAAKRAITEFLAGKTLENLLSLCPKGVSCGVFFPIDFPTSGTVDWSATFKSEGEARAFARTQLGSDAVEVEPGKWRSADGKWQYRAKPGDVMDNHVHLEELNPRTGEVIQNLHLRWPDGTGRP